MIQQMIQNLNQSHTKEISIPLSKDTFEILKLLEKEGYLTIIYSISNKLNQKKEISKNIIKIKKNLSWQIKQISKPSKKISLNYNNITQLHKFGLGISVFQTSKGFYSDKECIWHKIGGEWILKIF